MLCIDLHSHVPLKQRCRVMDSGYWETPIRVGSKEIHSSGYCGIDPISGGYIPRPTSFSSLLSEYIWCVAAVYESVVASHYFHTADFLNQFYRGLLGLRNSTTLVCTWYVQRTENEEL